MADQAATWWKDSHDLPWPSTKVSAKLTPRQLINCPGHVNNKQNNYPSLYIERRYVTISSATRHGSAHTPHCTASRKETKSLKHGKWHVGAPRNCKHAGKGKCCIWLVNKVEIYFAKIGFMDCKWSNLNVPTAYYTGSKVLCSLFWYLHCPPFSPPLPSVVQY